MSLSNYYGEEVPNFVRRKAEGPGHVLPGYDYDVTNQDALLHRMLVNGGLHTPEEITYRALALPTTRVISAAALAKAIEYVRGGGTLIGERPLRSLGVVSTAEAERFDVMCILSGPPASNPQGGTLLWATDNSFAWPTAARP